MGEEEILAAAVIADPSADLPRLLYADFMDRTGRSDRAAYIRAAITAAKTKHDHGQGSKCPACRAKRDRDARFWSVSNSVNFPSPFVTLSWRRGFVSHVNCDLDQWERGKSIARFHPLVQVAIADLRHHRDDLNRLLWFRAVDDYGSGQGVRWPTASGVPGPVWDLMRGWSDSGGDRHGVWKCWLNWRDAADALSDAFVEEARLP